MLNRYAPSVVSRSISAPTLPSGARQNGFARVYYADVEVFRILIFTQTYVRIYGEKAPASTP